MMLIVRLLLIFLVVHAAQGFVPVSAKLPSKKLLVASTGVEETLIDLAQKLKLEVYDIDDGIYGFDSKDYSYGLEVVKSSIKIDPSLGLELMEMARGSDGQGLVLVSGVGGNAALAEPQVKVGDAITGVIAGDHFRERTIGLDYDFTVEAIGKAKEASTDGTITLQINRLVPKSRILVEVDDGKSVRQLETLAGENLRTLLMRKQAKLYDPKTKRFDQPFATGDCAGEGICGTCLVSVEEGEELLSPKSDLENFITKGRPARWRAACRTIVGATNKEGKVRIRTHPQTGMDDELSPGAKDVSMRP